MIKYPDLPDIDSMDDMTSFTNTSHDICDKGLRMLDSGYQASLKEYVKNCLWGAERLQVLKTLYMEQKKLVDENLLSTEELALLISIYTVLLVFGSCGAVFVIYAVVRRPRMRTARNIFIVNLAISDLTLCLFTQPFNLLRILFWHYDWTLGKAMCKIVSIGQAANIYVSTMSIIAIAIDRLRVIVYPRHKKMESVGATVVICSSWFLALLMASPMAAYSTVSIDTIRPQGTVCGDVVLQSGWMRRSKLVHGWLTLTIHYFLPTAVVFFAYLRIWMHIRQNNRKLNNRKVTNGVTSDKCSIHHAQQFTQLQSPSCSRVTTCGNEKEHRVSVPLLDVHFPVPCQQTDVENITHTFSEVEGSEVCENRQHCCTLKVSKLRRQAFRSNSRKYRKKRMHRRDTRTNTLLTLMTLNLVLAWLPLHLYNIIIDFRESATSVFSDIKSVPYSDPVDGGMNSTEQPPFKGVQTSTISGRVFTLIHGFCLTCVLLGACINPVLYGWLNNNFRKELKYIFSQCLQKRSTIPITI